MTRITPPSPRLALMALGVAVASGACSRPAEPHDTVAATEARTAGAISTPARRSAPAAHDPAPAATDAAGAHPFSSADGLVRLAYPDSLRPGHDFGGRSLMAAGWRLMWDGKPAGPGTGVVSFAQDAKPATGAGYVTELVQIGMSRDPGVVATCGTAGMVGGVAARRPNRMLGGHRWTVWSAGDAGMSQQIDATDYRTVVDGICYAIDRASYAVKAGHAAPGLPTQHAAAARIDAVLASVRVGGR